MKDSFAVLPLEQAGFHVLFGAEWIAHPPANAVLPNDRWRRVESDDDLAAWEAAWGESAGAPRVFRPALLGRAGIAFLARVAADGSVDAGVIANRSVNVVGVSNFFAHGDAGVRREAVDAVARLHPGLPLVGYERGPALAEARALGFEALRPLRVWLAD